MTEKPLGELIDNLYETRQARLNLQKQVDELKSQELAARTSIMEKLDAVGLAKGTGSLATCGLKFSLEPVTEDWDSIFEYIRVNDRFDLIQKRLAAPAWRDLYGTGILVPGTAAVEVRDLSLTKSTRG